MTYLGIKDAPEQNPDHHQTPHHQQQDEEGLVLVLPANQLYAPREEERKYQEKQNISSSSEGSAMIWLVKQELIATFLLCSAINWGR